MQYDRLVATQKKQTVPRKSKAKAATFSDKSNYKKSSLEQEEEAEEEEMAADCFQHVVCNKHIAKKKADCVKAEQVLKYQAENDFSGRIPNRLEMKVWGLLNVKCLNLHFRGALSHCLYYVYYTNTILIGPNIN